MSEPRYEYDRDSVRIVHTTGKKDDHLVRVIPDGDYWDPTNEDIFTLILMWLTSEREEYGNRAKYKELMPWFYATMSMLATRHDTDGLNPYEKAIEGATLSDDEVREHFEECVAEYAVDLIELLEWMEQEAGR